MREFTYPFDADALLKRSKRLKKELLASDAERIHKNIAVLGGATTHDIVRILELFLLDFGIAPLFYESEFGQYYEDAMFPGEELTQFHPDVVYFHLSFRNIPALPEMTDSAETVRQKEDAAFAHFTQAFAKAKETHGCVVIADNFTDPYVRLLGNRDAYDPHGVTRFIRALNVRLSDYAAEHEGIYLHDSAYLAASYGLDAYLAPKYWYLYKYAQAVPAIPYLAHSVAKIIKSLYGRNKKALVLDLDNTLWGGVVGDDGTEGIEIGEETAQGEAYKAFQKYVKAQTTIGTVLTVASKNEEENALAGLRHPDGVLRPEDFAVIRANWDPKSENLKDIAKTLNILPEALVFADDNPAEREIVSAQLPGVAVPPLTEPEDYLRVLDHGGYFEATNVSADDLERSRMYAENAIRQQEEAKFTDYNAYLQSLEMRAVIAPFAPLYYPRISQLTNKSNQFNLTTKRMSVEEIAQTAENPDAITLYGRLKDKFGDNGIVSLVAGHMAEETFHIDLWLMSCRVLKRDMEYAMMDELVAACRAHGLKRIIGYYYPTAKNKMVEDFYALQGFEKTEETLDAATGRNASVWRFDIPEPYECKNKVITIVKGEEEDTQ